MPRGLGRHSGCTLDAAIRYWVASGMRLGRPGRGLALRQACGKDARRALGGAGRAHEGVLSAGGTSQLCALLLDVGLKTGSQAADRLPSMPAVRYDSPLSQFQVGRG